jgi:hypothetical protein
MNIFECQHKAEEGECEKFLLITDSINVCKWLDPYIGLIEVEGLDGFLMVSDIYKTFPEHECVITRGKQNDC